MSRVLFERFKENIFSRHILTMSPTITVASFFSSDNNVCVVDTFSTELLNYWTGKRKRI